MCVRARASASACVADYVTFLTWLGCWRGGWPVARAPVIGDGALHAHLVCPSVCIPRHKVVHSGLQCSFSSRANEERRYNLFSVPTSGGACARRHAFASWCSCAQDASRRSACGHTVGRRSLQKAALSVPQSSPDTGKCEYVESHSNSPSALCTALTGLSTRSLGGNGTAALPASSRLECASASS